MIDYTSFFQNISDSKLSEHQAQLTTAIEQGLSVERFGDLPGWLDALAQLPDAQARFVELDKSVEIGHTDELDKQQRQQLETQLHKLIPWRKGPYRVFGIDIDTEWRSDWKWDRVLPHLESLKDRTVLDVGCGNGYHCLRMAGAGAKLVIGIDPSPRFIVQFYMLKRFMTEIPVDILPIGIENLPENLEMFDTTFSMGVFYHRRSPMDHLRELKDTLRSGGQLVLETLVIEGELGEVLVPEGRYAMMNNVWFLPTTRTLCSWLKKCGFQNISVVDENVTTVEEQRSTDWMTFHSLANFLDPNDPSRTAEGHPAPRRAVFVATKP